jgi:hypothetical protein
MPKTGHSYIPDTASFDSEATKHTEFLSPKQFYTTLTEFAFDFGYYLSMLQNEPEAQFDEMVQLIGNYPDMLNFLRETYYEINGVWLMKASHNNYSEA